MSDDLDVETIRAACEALAQVREGLRDAHLRGFIESIDVLAEWVPALLTRCEELEATLARRRKRRQPTRTIGITDYSFVTQSKADELLRLAEARAEQAERRCEELEAARDDWQNMALTGTLDNDRAEQAERERDELHAALVDWWEMHRAHGWTAMEHGLNPEVNCPSDADKELARLAARRVLSESVEASTDE